ncbi:MAG: hypothetical protein IJU72_00810, partial [Bacteroidales bacterium]|nr:hypothetical protein [Bacteroidales bacterium]
MAETPKQQPPAELDLLEMLSYTGNALKSAIFWLFNLLIGITQWAIKIIVFSIKNIAWAIVFALLGYGGITLYQSIPRQKPITTELIAQSNALRESDVIEYINRTGRLLQHRTETNLLTVANNLNMQPSDVEQIRSLRAGWAIDTDGDGVPNRANYTKRDTSGAVDGMFYVELCAHGAIIAQVAQSLPSFLQDNPYFCQRHSASIQTLEALKASIDNEVEVLARLQETVYANAPKQMAGAAAPAAAGAAAGAAAPNFAYQIPLYHSDILSMKKQSQEIATKLN